MTSVRIEIAAGETLVTGGYQRANGQYELTFLSPTLVTQEDGTETIRLSSRILSVGPAFIAENDLGALTTRTRNTLQHAESWGPTKLKHTFKAASEHQSTEILSSPTVLTKSGELATLAIETQRMKFKIESNISKTSTGGFVLRAHVERAEIP